MNCKLLLQHASISDNESLNIYLFGSRVYGTAQIDADYDFFVVVTDDYFATIEQAATTDANHPFHNQWTNYRKNDTISTFRTLEFNISNETDHYSININLYKCSAWEELLKQNWYQALLCIYLPIEYKWREDIKIDFTLYHRRVLESVIAEAGKHWQLAQNSWDSTNPYFSKKYIVHTFRDLLFGRQIILHDRIIDYQEANEIYYQVMNCTETEWNHYKQYYGKYQQLKKEFGNIVNQVAGLEEDWSNDRSYTEQYLQKYRLERIRKCLSIDFTRFDNLMHLSCLEEAPAISKVATECGNGMVITTEFQIVGISIPRVFAYDTKNAPKIQWKNVTVTRIRENSELVTLYYHDGWKIFTRYDCEAKHASVFWKLLGDHIPDEVDHCFVFQIVTSDFLSLESVIHTESRKQVSIVPFLEKYNYTCSPDIIQETFSNANRVKNIADSLDPLIYTQVWVQDNLYNRVFVPCTQYTSLQNLYHNTATLYDIINIIKTTCIETSDERYLAEKIKYSRFCDFIDQLFLSFESTEKKDIAKSMKSLDIGGLFEPVEDHGYVRNVLLNVITKMKQGVTARDVLALSDLEKLVIPLYSRFV
jgi:hypothetical protein